MEEWSYEWDETKREANLRKHGIDFWDALDVFEGPHLMIRSDRNGEERWGALGLLGDRAIVVFFTPRGAVRRLISARSARRNERKIYHTHNAPGAPPGSD
ncbi:BrnT family toxin [Methylobacterium sp. J-090]|uniref:BrnT family toxin n=1 Tax=Methylobacterium sp. J-090 TaxID=2836666 RepID=UPI001FB94A0D|nr:BrnT family toxin [Methylobacterium sp. J-090]MCJ2082262.1 BrnT family toxin [Methylobacterium sp. J-090]